MLKLIKEGYEGIFKCYMEVYENETHKFVFQYPADENGNRLPVEDPRGIQSTGFDIAFVAPKDKIDGVRVRFEVVSREDGKEADFVNLLYVPDTKEEFHFSELHGATGKWVGAAKTMVELNELVEEKFPGYYITDKKEY